MPPINQKMEDLQAAWAARWEDALALWSRYTRLSDPRWRLNRRQAAFDGLTDSFAMIRLNDQAVVINLEEIAALHLEAYALEILGHEIGHHVYCPADLTDQARLIARMRRALPLKEDRAGLIANLYTDLLINNRLQRSAGLRMAEVYERLKILQPERALEGDRAPVENPESSERDDQGSRDPLWTFYMRIYEILWSLPKGRLAAGPIPVEMEGDAYLGSRLVRSYARQWLDGSGRFAALCFPDLPEKPPKAAAALRRWNDMKDAGKGGIPDGLTEIEAEELDGAIHPARDPNLTGLETEASGPPAENQGAQAGKGQYRQPFEYGQILKSLGLDLDDHEIAVRYYRERAIPHLVRFPAQVLPETSEPLPEGTEPWDISSPLENADWLQSVMISPVIIPGMTTVQRTWGTMAGSQPERRPYDLDLYVDCSGSMPDPQVNVSYPALAGTILCLSALRAGARVQATLWSGAGQFDTTRGFLRDERRILQILTGYLGGGTAFPIHILRDTYLKAPSGKPPGPPRKAHILVISDNGVTTMFDKDEQGNSGWDVAAAALKNAGGGGTLALDLYQPWEKDADLVKASQMGWAIYPVASQEDLLAFARQFSARTYGSL